ncbi:hypothetical protein LINGRAHAP2_LOCUS33321 [Linum grandiflorum]
MWYLLAPGSILLSANRSLRLFPTVIFFFLFQFLHQSIQSNNGRRRRILRTIISRRRWRSITATTPCKLKLEDWLGAARTQAPAATNYDVGSPTLRRP